MKKPNSENVAMLVWVAAGILFLCVVCQYYTAGNDHAWVDYSVSSDEAKGYSAFYSTLKKMGLKVKTAYVPLNQIALEDCQILVDDSGIDAGQKEEWIQQGGMLVLIEDESDTGVQITEEGKGILIQTGSREALTNKSLMEDSETAYELYSALVSYGEGRSILFNEYYMYGDEEKLSLWQVTPAFLKAMLIQLAGCAVLFIFYKGKRFGKAQVLVEEAERTENEYLYAAAGMYQQAKAWDVVLISFYQLLERQLKLLSRREGPFLTGWQEEGLPDNKMAESVAAYMAQIQAGSGQKIDKKQAMQMLSRMEHLMKILDQRRKRYWKL